jgi:hypothetical protein
MASVKELRGDRHLPMCYEPVFKKIIDLIEEFESVTPQYQKHILYTVVVNMRDRNTVATFTDWDRYTYQNFLAKRLFTQIFEWSVSEKLKLLQYLRPIDDDGPTPSDIYHSNLRATARKSTGGKAPEKKIRPPSPRRSKRLREKAERL